MTFEEVLNEAVAMLKRQGRVSYRGLKRQFNLDDDYLTDLKDEMLYIQSDIAKDGDRGLVWTGELSEPRDAQSETNGETRFQQYLLAVIGLFRVERRVTYRTLKYVLSLDDALLNDIRKELSLRRLAIDEDGEVLVWTGADQPITTSMPFPISEDNEVKPPVAQDRGPFVVMTDTQNAESVTSPKSTNSVPEAERRQLTVMFCDLVGSTDLSGQLDPEDLRELIRAYQETAAEVIERYEGHIAQYLGDGLLVYFGFPVAHENDAQRAVHSGLGILEAMSALNTRLEAGGGEHLSVRIGIHTGPVVVGEMGGGGRHENLALGETPNIAARLEGLAPPNTMVISPVTARLVRHVFTLEESGPHDLKGIVDPMVVSRVLGLRHAEPEVEGPATRRVVTLVGRDEEIGLLRRRWEQSKEGLGQVVLISGEAGIGKSSLVHGLRAHVRQEGLTRTTFQCSPYHTNSALYPIIEQVQRALEWQAEDPVEVKLTKLEQGLQGTSLSLAEAVPLLAVLLSLPLPQGTYAAPTLTPQQQRQQTQDILVTWLLEVSERQPVLAVWEDLHWADPSTLELLGLMVEQAPTAAMLHVLTYRPEFEPPWTLRSHLTPLTLNRMERPQVEALIARLAQGNTLPAEVTEHIVLKTDGVPLYVEELTKMLLESDLIQEEDGQYVLTGPLSSVAIPDTLQDSLMARLDQMNSAKEVAQLGAVLGREFSYEIIQAISSQNEETLQSGLTQLVEAELLYQRGRPPRSRYLFKHALIQDAAYASLLKSTRQRVHQQIAQWFEAYAPEVAQTQPELVAHHYTEAACHPQAIAYWQLAGQRAVQRSAYAEAYHHLTQGLALLETLPDLPDRVETELGLRTTLGPALMAMKGQSSSEVEDNYGRARELCQQVGDTPQLFSVMWGLWRFYNVTAQFQIARELGEQLLAQAQRTDHTMHRLAAHHALSFTLFPVGEYILAREQFEQARADYDRKYHRDLIAMCAQDSGVSCLALGAWALWGLGWPEQAIQCNQEAITLAEDLSHPFSLGWALVSAAAVRQQRREVVATLELSESAIALATEHGFPAWNAWGMILHGWALAAQGHTDEGIKEIQQGRSLFKTINFSTIQTYSLALLADAYRLAGEVTTAFDLLTEALAVADRTGEGFYVAELHRLRGELLLHVEFDMQMTGLTPEDCLQQALDVARSQQTKSLELRAATSLALVWQSHDMRGEAYGLLAPLYGWFTEGLDTSDLQDAKALIDELER